ncbi:MAG: hypothetical protein R6T98_12465 [Desulfatiglandales bacterium]
MSYEQLFRYFYWVKLQCGLTLPITLNYSSNGLKVDKIASWVGFDWSLSAGGIITRNVAGVPDNPNSRIVSLKI